MAVTDEAGVAEHLMRARGKLIQEGVDALAQRAPVVGQAVELEHVLTQPAPDFLDGIEPGGVGRQPDQLQARQVSQGRLHVVMVVDGPIVLDDVVPLGPRIHVIQLQRAGDHLRAADQVVVPVVHPPSQRVECANEALLAIGRAGASRQRGGVRGGQHPVGSGSGPAVVAHLVDEHQRHRFRLAGRLAKTALPSRDLGQVVRIGTVQLEPRGAQPQSGAVQPAPDAAQAVVSQCRHRAADGAQRPAAGRGATRRRPGHLTRLLAWWLMQSLHDGLLLLAVEAASGGCRPADGRAGRTALPAGSAPATRPPCRGAALSAARGERPSRGLCPRRSSAARHTAPARRGAGRGPDEPPTPATAPNSTLPFAAKPSHPPPALSGRLASLHHYPFWLSKFIRPGYLTVCRSDTKSCWVLYNGSMGGHLVLVAHLNAHDVERRYRTAKQAVERTWWQIVWLVSQGQTATEIARSTGFTRGWIGQVVKRYNTLGPEGLYDRRRTHARRQPLALSEEQQTEVLAVLQGPPPHGERWTGRLVAGWMSRRLGRPIPRQLGWVYLVRLKGKRWVPRPRQLLADAEQQVAFKKRAARSSMPCPPPSRGRRSSSGRPTSTAAASSPSSRRSGASADGGPVRPSSTATRGAPASALSIPPRAGPCGTWLQRSPSPSSRSSWQHWP